MVVTGAFKMLVFFFTFSSLLGFLFNEQSDSVVNTLGQLRFFISWDIPEFVKL